MGQSQVGNIHCPSINEVYVNGMQNIAINISDMDRLIRYFHISDVKRSQVNRTKMANRLAVNENMAVAI